MAFVTVQRFTFVVNKKKIALYRLAHTNKILCYWLENYWAFYFLNEAIANFGSKPLLLERAKKKLFAGPPYF